MGREEARIEILALLPQITENQLFGVVEYLRELVSLSNIDKEISSHLGKIILEDDDLLKKLAQ